MTSTSILMLKFRQKLFRHNLQQKQFIYVGTPHFCRMGWYKCSRSRVSAFEIAYNNSHYGYYHLLSGVDLPLKSKEYIYSFFMQSGKEFIGFCPYNDTLSDIRVRTYHFFVSKMRNNRFYRLLDRIIAKCLVVFDCLRNKEIYFRKGSTWVSVTNDFVRYMLANKTMVLELYKHTFEQMSFSSRPYVGIHGFGIVYMIWMMNIMVVKGWSIGNAAGRTLGKKKITTNWLLQSTYSQESSLQKMQN